MKQHQPEFKTLNMGNQNVPMVLTAMNKDQAEFILLLFKVLKPTIEKTYCPGCLEHFERWMNDIKNACVEIHAEAMQMALKQAQAILAGDVERPDIDKDKLKEDILARVDKDDMGKA